MIGLSYRGVGKNADEDCNRCRCGTECRRLLWKAWLAKVATQVPTLQKHEFPTFPSLRTKLFSIKRESIACSASTASEPVECHGHIVIRLHDDFIAILVFVAKLK